MERMTDPKGWNKNERRVLIGSIIGAAAITVFVLAAVYALAAASRSVTKLSATLFENVIVDQSLQLNMTTASTLLKVDGSKKAASYAGAALHNDDGTTICTLAADGTGNCNLAVAGAGSVGTIPTFQSAPPNNRSIGDNTAGATLAAGTGLNMNGNPVQGMTDPLVATSQFGATAHYLAANSLSLFTTTLNGTVPAPGSVSGKVLSDNGTWITPAASGVTSVSCGNGMTCTPSPITSTGSVALTLGTNTDLMTYTTTGTANFAGKTSNDCGPTQAVSKVAIGADGSLTATCATFAAAGGLYNQAMSATPTAASTGFANWWNQPTSATTSDVATGMVVFSPNQSGNNICARRLTAPGTPYTLTILVSNTSVYGGDAAVVFGWSSGTTGSSPLEFIYYLPYEQNNQLQVDRYNSATSFNSAPYTVGSKSFFNNPLWLQISDDGTAVHYRTSQDGVNFIQFFTVTKSGSFLGASGYSNVIFGVHASSMDGYATILSWKQT